MSSSNISTSSQMTILPDEHKSNNVINNTTWRRKILCNLGALFMLFTIALSIGSILLGADKNNYLYNWLIVQGAVHLINFMLLLFLGIEIARMDALNVSFKFLFFVSIYHAYIIISTFIGFVLFWINYDLIQNGAKSVMYCDLIYNCIFMIIIEIYKYFILLNQK